MTLPLSHQVQLSGNNKIIILKARNTKIKVFLAFLFCYQILMLKVNVICGRFKNAFTFLCYMSL